MRIWCWVRDTTTGAHFDVPLGQHLDQLIARGAVVEIPNRRQWASRPRSPKRLVDLSGRPANPGRGRTQH